MRRPHRATRATADGAASRVELDLAVAAAVSDHGLVHHRNEDSFALEVTGEGA